jgi:L-threonylcarbamoyladenylate synthase
MKKNTKILDPSQVDVAAEITRKGGIVAFPTETVYGLGADALNDKAIKKVFKAKKRPLDNPVIVHISSLEQLKSLAERIPHKARILADKFWPGPLTIIVRKKKEVPYSVTAGLNSVAIRMPSNEIARELIERSGTPIAAPSANLSGKPSPTHHSHAIEDLKGRADAIIKGGETEIGLESTVIDMTRTIPTILRPGKITPRMIQNQIGFVSVYNKKVKKDSKVPSPGMKYRHYSPKAQVILVRYSQNQKARIRELASSLKKEGKKIIVLSRQDIRIKGIKRILLGDSILDMSRKVFRYFREADKEGYDTILIEGTMETGLGLALMNRLKRAASIVTK